MNTKLLAPVTMALVLGLSACTAALAQYSETTTVKTTPTSTSDAAANGAGTASLIAKHEEHANADYGPNPERTGPVEGTTRSRVTPAKMFQLRDSAGG